MLREESIKVITLNLEMSNDSNDMKSSFNLIDVEQLEKELGNAKVPYLQSVADIPKFINEVKRWLLTSGDKAVAIGKVCSEEALETLKKMIDIKESEILTKDAIKKLSGLVGESSMDALSLLGSVYLTKFTRLDLLVYVEKFEKVIKVEPTLSKNENLCKLFIKHLKVPNFEKQVYADSIMNPEIIKDWGSFIVHVKNIAEPMMTMLAREELLKERTSYDRVADKNQQNASSSRAGSNTRSNWKSRDDKNEYKNEKKEKRGKYCTNCKRKSHDTSDCWVLHPELKTVKNEEIKIEQTSSQPSEHRYYLRDRNNKGNHTSNSNNEKTDRKIESKSGKKLSLMNSNDSDEKLEEINEELGIIHLAAGCEGGTEMIKLEIGPCGSSAIYAVVDTGASASFIRKDAVNKLIRELRKEMKITRLKKPRVITLADGTTQITATHQLTTVISSGGKSQVVNLLIMNNLFTEIILGNDVRMCVNTKTQEVQLLDDNEIGGVTVNPFFDESPEWIEDFPNLWSLYECNEVNESNPDRVSEQGKIPSDGIPEEYKEYVGKVFTDDISDPIICEPYKIGVKNGCKSVGKVFSTNESKRKYMNDEISALLKKRIIEPSKSAISSPAFVVENKKKKRLVIDYREVNQYVVVEQYPIAKIEDLVRKVRGSCWFNKFDMRKGYLQIPIAEESRDVTSFVPEHGLYRYCRLP
ncbi:MAG: hypothetical protein QG641_2154, partial [Candidatus Poribacteria bacterium]|nr:hypothetical protein [Candidatus Poribacteria bacterium]